MMHLEDLAVGVPFHCGIVRADAEEVTAFAAHYSPHPFHLDADATADSVFGRTAAPFLHTLAMCMGCMVRAIRSVAIVCDLGIDGITAARPVYPGDVLRVDACWTDARLSTIMRGQGVARIVVRGFAEDGGDAIRFAARYVVRCRRSGDARPHQGRAGRS